MSDLRTSKTLRSLKKAFLDLLEKKRFEDISVQQLCQEAEIRRATFYNHFQDKYDFLAFFIQEMRDEFIAALPEYSSEDKDKEEPYNDQIFHQLIAFFESHPQLVKNLKNSQLLPSMMEIFSEAVRHNVFLFLEVHQPDAKESNEMKAAFYSGGIMQLILIWIKNPKSYPIDSVNWLDYLREK